MPSSVVTYDAAVSKPLLDEVQKRSGQNLQACYQCRRCAAGCPVGEETGVTPDRLITHRMGLPDVRAALDLMARGNALKILIEP